MSDSLIEGFNPGKRPFLNDRPGEYVLELEEFAEGVSGKDDLPYVKADVTVVASTGDEAYKPGTPAVIVIKKNADKKKDFSSADMQKLAAAIIGEEAIMVTKETLRELKSPDQPAKGSKFKAHVGIHKSKKGTEYRGVVYSPMGQ